MKEGDDIYGHTPGGGVYADFLVAQGSMIALKPRQFRSQHKQRASPF